MHIPLRPIDRAIEKPFQQIQKSKHRRNLYYGPAVGNGIQALGEDLGEDVDGHCWREWFGTALSDAAAEM